MSQSGVSMKSSRTYISQLERKLHMEREAREKLQKEVEELKKISSTIATQYGQGKGCVFGNRSYNKS